MKYILIFMLLSNCILAQSTRRISKDFDGDSIKDTVYIDSDTKKLVCLLSTQHFKKMESKGIPSLNFGNTLVETKKGFEFWNDYDRSGFINEFLYNKVIKKMQLIKITRTDYDISWTKYGEKVKGGSGKSTIDLLTNNYIGDFYAVIDEKLIKLPLINAKIVLTETTIENFSDAIYFNFEKKCVALYEEQKAKMK
ncbi:MULTISPECIES: hypothetical protein [Flavobacterium]|uniref:Uncharacterized protein n=1 Tax=Flavobacterium jumunjinense TaxID=998845 RepID=A0ABV5GSW2_9FLAO|nr:MULTISPECIES: hypothetical protein [Flavobacterium]